jgi:sugar transferase (PEP-CTERM/EpsH1 system associated)
MRILWLKSDLLPPLDTGGKLRTWHLLRHLARRHEVTYLAFDRPGRPAADLEMMREVAARVETVPRDEPAKGTWRFYADAARHVFDPLPYAVAKYRSPAFRRRLAELFAESTFDLIVCDFLFPAVNLPQRLPCPSVIFTHNVEAEIWRRHAATKTGIAARLLYSRQHRRMLRYEGRTLQRFDGVLAVSEADRDTFARLYPDAIRTPVHIVPTGVDTEFFKPTSSAVNTREIVFTGSMDWLPNEDAMRYFCRHVLPHVHVDEPDVSLSIVGRAPTPGVRSLADEAGVRVTGRVDDVRPFMDSAVVYVVPLRIGGGTRLKIFEAMAMGRAVVSTTVGAEGLPVVDGEHLLIADDPRAFARAIVRLIRDREQRERLGAAARALVVRQYDWSAVAGALEEPLMRIALGQARGDRAVPLLPGAAPVEAGAAGPVS